MTDTPETLEGISAKYGISRERVRQIEQSAFKKLKNMVLLAIKKQAC